LQFPRWRAHWRLRDIVIIIVAIIDTGIRVTK
jgi:hypothetical protein